MPMWQRDCPVCEKKWQNNHQGIRCPNGCYETMYVKGGLIIRVFDTTFSYRAGSDPKEANAMKKEIEDLIKHYKEDDRYVGEILARTNKE